MSLKDLTAEDFVHCFTKEQKEQISKMLEFNSDELMGSNAEAEDYLDGIATLVRQNTHKEKI